jgi:hypothetical protein
MTINPNDIDAIKYDEALLKKIWYARNPSHDINTNTGEDMFWKTAFMVFQDYLKEVTPNN